MLREAFIQQIEAGFHTSSIVALLGLRQCGKTTLARQYFNAYQGAAEC